MVIETSDVRSNPNEQIAHAATVIGKSEFRKKVFEEIHRGKTKLKSISEIVNKTKLDKKKVYEATNYLSQMKIIKKTKKNGELAYERDDFFYRNKRKILKMAGNEELLKKYPTKRNIKSHEISVKITVKKESVDFKRLTIDHIDSFKKVKNVSFSTNTRAIPIAEEIFKKGLQRVIGEEGKFTDWGGELDDLYTNRIMLEEKRITVAFGLKGKGKWEN